MPALMAPRSFQSPDVPTGAPTAAYATLCGNSVGIQEPPPGATELLVRKFNWPVKSVFEKNEVAARAGWPIIQSTNDVLGRKKFDV